MELAAVRDFPHVVQLYDADEAALVTNVGAFLAAGYAHGDALIVVAGPDHQAAFTAELGRRGIDAAAGRLVMLDAAETLAMLCDGDGRPHPSRFAMTVGATVRDLARRFGGVTAYGEMVGLLWRDERPNDALSLEELWNGLRAKAPLALFCGYPIDVFGREFGPGIDRIVNTHSELLPCAHPEKLSTALETAMSDVLGNADALRSLMASDLRSGWNTHPMSEATILWLRLNLPAHAEAIVKRARALYHAAV